MITDRDPGDEHVDRDVKPDIVPMCGDCWDTIATCQCPPSSPSGRLLASKPVRL